MNDISKRFGAVRALRGVGLRVKAGTVHALIGENGAGKSTLMKILAGSLGADAGTVMLEGKPYAATTPREARARGVSMIYQELTLAPHLSVADNVTLGAEIHRGGIVRSRDEEVRRALTLLGHGHLDLSLPVGRLGIGVQQIVEIARSLLLDARLIIMDEPTSSLSGEDTRALFTAIDTLRSRGVTVVYISHFLEEVQTIADRYTVLRDGCSVASGAIRDTTLGELVTHMVGRSLREMFPRVPHERGALLLKAEAIRAANGIRDASLELHRGEILGIAGLVGSGRTELVRCLTGLDTAESGTVTVGDAPPIDLASGHSPRASLKAGVSMVSENRKDEGLAVTLPIRDNMTLSSLRRFTHTGLRGMLDLVRERAVTANTADGLAIRYDGIVDPVSSLSGGNQQKVALGRVLIDGSEVLLLDEPTRGIDVGSKVEIYRLMGRLAAEGKGVIMVSSYLPELLGVCDTLAVMHRGTLSPLRPVEEWSEEQVMAWATTGKLHAS
jgi:ribose transport system ATP-binding protein